MAPFESPATRRSPLLVCAERTVTSRTNVALGPTVDPLSISQPGPMKNGATKDGVGGDPRLRVNPPTAALRPVERDSITPRENVAVNLCVLLGRPDVDPVAPMDVSSDEIPSAKQVREEGALDGVLCPFGMRSKTRVSRM